MIVVNYLIFGKPKTDISIYANRALALSRSSNLHNNCEFKAGYLTLLKFGRGFTRKTRIKTDMWKKWFSARFDGGETPPGPDKQKSITMGIEAGLYPLGIPLIKDWRIIMTRLIPAAERIVRARALIQKARDLPAPTNMGWADFSYVAQVKDLMRQARELIKLIPFSPSASAELKEEVKKIFEEAEQAEKEILKK